MSRCIIAMDNCGSKAPIRLSRRGRSCLAELLNLGCSGHSVAREFSRLFNPVYLFDNKTVPGNMVMVAIVMCEKSTITGEWIYVLPFMLFVYLFVCLFLLRFYICNIWFVSANNRCLIFIIIIIIIIIIILKF